MNLQQFSDELRKNPEFVIAELQLKLDEANKKIAELEARQRWVPVGERLPKDDKSVLIFDKSDGVLCGWHVSNVPQWNSQDGFYYHGNMYDQITHWMPLPEPPEVTN